MKKETHPSFNVGKKEILIHPEFVILMDTLEEEIRSTGKEYEFVFPVPRGGWVPAAYLAHRLDLKVFPIFPTPIQADPKKLLVVDDLVDTGTTLAPFVKAGYDIAVIFKKPWAKVTPTYFADVTKNWIIFDWEKVKDWGERNWEEKRTIRKKNAAELGSDWF